MKRKSNDYLNKLPAIQITKTKFLLSIGFGVVTGFLIAVSFIHPEFLLNLTDDLPQDVIYIEECE